jgi:hypothetical protein
METEMTMEVGKRVGRPLKDHGNDGRVTVGISMPAALKTLIQEHAERENRALTREIVLALHRAYRPDEPFKRPRRCAA